MHSKNLEFKNLEFKILESMQPGTRHRVSNIARRVGVARSTAQSALDRLVTQGNAVRDTVTSPKGRKKIYYFRPWIDANCATEKTLNQPARLSSRDVLCTMEPGVGYTALDLSKKLGVDLKRVYAWLPRLRIERYVTECPKGSKPRCFYLTGTEPVEETTGSIAIAKPTRIVNGCINGCDNHPFEQEYAKQLKQLAMLSRLSRHVLDTVNERAQ